MKTTLTREEILSAAEEFHDCLAEGDIPRWLSLFSEQFTFQTSFMPEPVANREALSALVLSWPLVLNSPEWHAIDGNRLVLGWSERLPSMQETVRSYRGISTLVFDDDCRITLYEGVFDTTSVLAAVGQ